MRLDVEDMQDQRSIQSEATDTMKPLQKIGEMIRKAREERSMSIEDLAGSLRIGQEQLIALEKGEEDLLPEKVFIKAMIRRVSERLHLDIGILLNEFYIEEHLTRNNSDIQKAKFPDLNYLGKIPTWALISGLIAITSSGFAISFLNTDSTRLIHNTSQPKKLLAPKTKAIDSSYHIVAPGQTLSTISKFHEIPLKQLIQINDLNNPDKLKIGTKLSLKVKERRGAD